MSRMIPAAVVLALTLILGARQSTQAQADPSWIGKRVVQTRSDFALQQEGQALQPTKRAICIYVVARSKGRALWIKAEGNGPSGWAQREQVVPVEEAIEFFTDRLRSR